MIRPCPKCGKINSINTLWCINCNSKLYQTINEPLNPPPSNEDEIFTKDIKPVKKNHSHHSGVKLFLFAIVTIGIIVMLITSLSFYFNQCPKTDPVFEQLGENFYYADGKIVTADGTIYNVSEIRDYKLNGIIQDLSLTDENSFDSTPFEFLTTFLGGSNSNLYNCSLTTVNDNQRIDMQILCNSTEDNLTHEHLTENKLIFLNCEDKQQLNEDIDIDDEIIIEGTVVNIEYPQIQDRGNSTNFESSSEFETTTSQVVIVEKVTVKKSNN